jgi:hypothetical protein
MLVENLTTPDCQAPLLLVAAWVIGEFGTELLAEPPALPTGSAESIIPVGPQGQKRTHEDLVALLGSLLTHHKASTEIRGVALTAITKLLVKAGSSCPPDVVELGRNFLGMFSASLNQELQARSVEFLTLTSGDVSAAVLGEVVEPIPVLTAAAVSKLRWGAEAAEQAELSGAAIDEPAELDDSGPGGPGGPGGGSGMQSMTTTSATATDAEASQHAASTQALSGGMDGDEVLLDLFGGSATPTPSPSASDAGAAASSGSGDPMADLFAPAPAPAAATDEARAPAPAPSKAIDVAALFAAGPGGAGMGVPGAGMGAPGAGMLPEAFPEIAAMTVGPVRVTLQVTRDATDPTAATITLRAYRSGSDTSSPISGVVVESAVAKYMSQSVGAPDSRTIASGSVGPVTRTVRAVNPMRGSKAFKLLLRAQCDGPSGKITAKADVTAKLPPGL